MLRHCGIQNEFHIRCTHYYVILKCKRFIEVEKYIVIRNHKHGYENLLLESKSIISHTPREYGDKHNKIERLSLWKI